jgi:hypothetical protein
VVVVAMVVVVIVVIVPSVAAAVLETASIQWSEMLNAYSFSDC